MEQYYTHAKSKGEAQARTPSSQPSPYGRGRRRAERAVSGQEIQCSQGVNAGSFDQPGNIYILIGLMRLFGQPGTTDDHWRTVGGNKYRTISRIGGRRGYRGLSGHLITHTYEGLDLGVIKGNVQWHPFSNRSHLCLKGRILGTELINELAYGIEDLLVVLTNDRTCVNGDTAGIRDHIRLHATCDGGDVHSEAAQ